MRIICPACQLRGIRNVIAEQMGDLIIFRGKGGNGAIVEGVREYECGRCHHRWTPEVKRQGTNEKAALPRNAEGNHGQRTD